MNQEEIDAYWAGVKEVIPPVIEYRIHYDELGQITMCSMVDHPDNTRYIVVDVETYENYFRYHVVNGNLVKIEHDAGYRVKLKKSDKGFKVVKNNAGLLLEDLETHSNTEFYEYRNN